jgi:hypothetical protein
MTITTMILTVIIPAMVLLAIIVDVGALLGWLRRRWR